jgi:DnaK suppressor protein
MNERQREYFRRRLLAWREEVVKETRQATPHLLDEQNRSDVVDRASADTDRSLELRARGRQHKLISKIDAALDRLDNGTYGFCEETGEPIALSRLEARPIATFSLDAQERHERKERQYRND